MAQELKTNTAVRISVGPFTDVGDGKTPETAMTVTGITCELYQEDDDGTAVNRTAITLSASGGNNDMIHITDDTAGMYDLELTAAQLNFLGRATLTFHDDDVCLPVWKDLEVVSAQYYNAKYGTGNFSADAKAVGGTNQTGRDLGASVLLSVGTGTGQVNLSSGKVPATVAAGDIASSAITAATFAADVDAEIATMIWNAATASYGGAGTYGQAVEDTIEDTGTTLPATLATIAGYIDTEVASILAAVDTEVAAILADTNELQTNQGAWATATGFSTAAELAKVPKSDGTSSWNATALAAIQSECNDALVATRLDELLAVDSDIDGAAPPTVGSVFHELMTKTAGSFTFDQATDSLEAVRDRGDAAWITATGFSTHSAADVKTAVEAAGSHLALILEDTGTTLDGRIPASLVSGRMDASAGAVASGAINNAAFAADVGSTAFATNIIALAAFKALDAAITDGVSLTAGGLLEKVRKLTWIFCNKAEVTDLNGNTVIYKDDSTTAAYTVNAMLTDDLTTTTRLRAA